MKLNHDCIRDLIIFIEDTTTASKPYVLSSQIYDYLSHKYDDETLNYHIIYIYEADIVRNLSLADGNIPITIWDLTPIGHDYANNIRNNKVWDKLKVATSKFTSISLPILIEKSSEILLNMIT